ncbi:hypothetical protein Ahy_A01g002158 [Arachis hypogaea]|uniref:Putative plant transposon protein domain-containing protein n=1 Tax=Arachis hypogaea TaxID=3818 RepID=A0A445EQ65_ARAHY|nr:hypothetical protein Ahy_A01g002158 [Arachis hypogaea]
MPVLHPGVTRYEDIKDELARVERERAEKSHESVRKALEDWKRARMNQMQGSAKYSRGENTVPQSIACTDLNPEARIWQQIIADYILLSTHATYIRVRVAVLLWVILEGKRISVLPLIGDLKWKVTQQKKYNISFPSLITRLATLSGVESRPTDRTSVYNSKQPFLPYGDYEGQLQKKRKTTEPSSTSAEPSVPPAPPVSTPRLQTPYKLGREILESLHHIESRNARCFQWIVAKFDGHDPRSSPPDTPEPEPEPDHETEEPALEEPAAEADQADEPIEQTAAENIVEEPADHIVEEPTAVAEPSTERASESAGQSSEEHRPKPTSQPSTDIIVYHHHHHPPPLGDGAS